MESQENQQSAAAADPSSDTPRPLLSYRPRSSNNRSRNQRRSAMKNRSRNNRRSANRRRDDTRGYQGYQSTNPEARPAVPTAPKAAYVSPVSEPVEAPTTFYCQLAHGGPTAIINTPNNLSEVYEAIASKYDGLSSDDILYCTVNTFKPEMDHLLTTNLQANDFIFAHTRGTRKEVTLVKDDTMLGVTLTDNGNGKVFIKRIKDDSVAARSQPAVVIGDHIEKINGQSVLDTRHYNVAAMLRAIPVGESFTLRLIEPQRCGFSFVAPRSASKIDKSKSIENGTQTLRFRAHGNAVMEEAPSKIVVDKINGIFETYLGFNDDVLALAGWDIAAKAKNYVELKNLFADSDLGGFGFPDELLFDIWGAVDDYRKNRIPPASEPIQPSDDLNNNLSDDEAADCKTN